MRRSISASAVPWPLDSAIDGPHGLQRGQFRAPSGVDPEAGQLVGEVVQAGERRGEDDPGAVAQIVGELPPVRQLAADRGRAVVEHERDSGVAQRVDTGADGQLGLPSEGGHPLGGDAELRSQVELAGSARQLDHVGGAVDRLEARTGLRLHEAGDVLVEDLVADPRRDGVDPLLAAQDARDVGVIEHVCRPGQAECGARDDDGLGRWCRSAVGEHGAVLVEVTGEHPTELEERRVSGALPGDDVTRSAIDARAGST